MVIALLSGLLTFLGLERCCALMAGRGRDCFGTRSVPIFVRNSSLIVRIYEQTYSS